MTRIRILPPFRFSSALARRRLSHLIAPRGIDDLVERIAVLNLDLFEEHHVELVVGYPVGFDLGSPLGKSFGLSPDLRLAVDVAGRAVLVVSDVEVGVAVELRFPIGLEAGRAPQLSDTKLARASSQHPLQG